MVPTSRSTARASLCVWAETVPATPSGPTARHLPGFSAPAVGFEQPFAMLEACHERVQRTLALLARLRAHVRQHGADEDARQAAKGACLESAFLRRYRYPHRPRRRLVP